MSSLEARTLSWPGLELRHLVALRAAVDEGSFAGAAARLGYTQGAISQQIAALERAVGHRLLIRPGGRLRLELTAAGQILLVHADAVARELAVARASLSRLANPESQMHLRVGIRTATGLALLPSFIERLQTSPPRIAPLDADSDASLLKLVAFDRVDVALVALPASEFESQELVVDPFVCVVGAEHAGDAPPFATCEWLGRQRLLMLKSTPPPFAEPGVDRYFYLEHPEALCELAARGMGVAVLPLTLVPVSDKTVVVELADPVHRRIYAQWRTDSDASEQLRTEFIRVAQEVLHGRAEVARRQPR